MQMGERIRLGSNRLNLLRVAVSKYNDNWALLTEQIYMHMCIYKKLY